MLFICLCVLAWVARQTQIILRPPAMQIKPVEPRPKRERESGCTYSHSETKTTLNSDSLPKHSEMLRCLLLPPTKLSPAFCLQAKLDLHLISACHWRPAKSMANKHKAHAYIWQNSLFIITRNKFVIATSYYWCFYHRSCRSAFWDRFLRKKQFWYFRRCHN